MTDDLPSHSVNRATRSGKVRLWLGALIAIMCVGDAFAQHKGIGIEAANGQPLQNYKQSVALIIGVSDYTQGWPDLNSVPAELDEVEAALISNGFDKVIRVRNPTELELKNAFESFIDEYGFDTDNRLLFFFSGHGHTRLNGTKGYLVPSDAPNPNVDEHGFLQKAVGMNDVLGWARKIEARHALFLFDSCFSGTLFNNKSLPGMPPLIQGYTDKPVRQFITAGSANEKVPEKSVFTPTFVRALTGEGDLNHDGYVTGSELGMYISDKVANYNAGQTPQYGKIRDPLLDEGDFIFTLPRSAGQFSSETQQSLSDLVAEELARWQRVRQCNNIQQLQRFVSDFPHGKFVSAAKGCLSQLTDGLGIPFFVDTLPQGAEVNISDIASPYTYGLPLLAGAYHIEVSEPGFASQNLDFVLTQQNSSVLIRLNKLEDTQKPLVQDRSYVLGDTSFTMKAIPAGTFMMGSIDGEDNQQPPHKVNIKAFKLMESEVTWQLYQVCIDAEVCKDHSREGGNKHLAKGNHPLTFISWHDATKTFIPWLNNQTGQTFRLPTEAEWEYAATAGSVTKYSWGDNIDCTLAQYDGGKGSDCYYKSKDAYRGSAEVKTYAANAFGLFDMHGNVWEWVQDCWNERYTYAPSDGRGWKHGDCTKAVIRGGSWFSLSATLESAQRGRYNRDERNFSLGLRLAQDN